MSQNAVDTQPGSKRKTPEPTGNVSCGNHKRNRVSGGRDSHVTTTEEYATAAIDRNNGPPLYRQPPADIDRKTTADIDRKNCPTQSCRNLSVNDPVLSENAATLAPPPTTDADDLEEKTGVVCPFCKLRLEFQRDNVRRKLATHVRDLCPAVKQEPEWVKQSLTGTSPKPNQQLKPLPALVMEVELIREDLNSFRRRPYKLEKNEYQFPESTFNPISKNEGWIIVMTCLLVFQASRYSESQPVERVNRGLNVIKANNQSLLHASVTASSRHAVTIKLAIGGQGIILNNKNQACLSVESSTNRTKSNLAPSILEIKKGISNMSLDKSPEGGQDEESKIHAVCKRFLRNLNLRQVFGAANCSLTSWKAITNSAFYVPYQITVPLDSTTKAAEIVEKIWQTGGSFILAKPTGARGRYVPSIRTPVIRAWIANSNFRELLHQKRKEPLKIAAVVSSIGEYIAGPTSVADSIGEIIFQYWACDLKALPRARTRATHDPHWAFCNDATNSCSIQGPTPFSKRETIT